MSTYMTGEFYVELDAPVRGVDGDGWAHHAFAYEIIPTAFGAEDRCITGTYRVGTGVHKNTVTGEGVLRSVASDIAAATDYWCATPDVRSMIAALEEDYGVESPSAAYDTAVELVRFSDWYWSLSTEEQQELQDIAAEED